MTTAIANNLLFSFKDDDESVPLFSDSEDDNDNLDVNSPTTIVCGNTNDVDIIPLSHAISSPTNKCSANRIEEATEAVINNHNNNYASTSIIETSIVVCNQKLPTTIAGVTVTVKSPNKCLEHELENKTISKRIPKKSKEGNKQMEHTSNRQTIQSEGYNNFFSADRQYHHYQSQKEEVLHIDKEVDNMTAGITTEKYSNANSNNAVFDTTGDRLNEIIGKKIKCGITLPWLVVEDKTKEDKKNLQRKNEKRNKKAEKNHYYQQKENMFNSNEATVPTGTTARVNDGSCNDVGSFDKDITLYENRRNQNECRNKKENKIKSKGKPKKKAKKRSKEKNESRSRMTGIPVAATSAISVTPEDFMPLNIQNRSMLKNTMLIMKNDNGFAEEINKVKQRKKEKRRKKKQQHCNIPHKKQLFYGADDDAKQHDECLHSSSKKKKEIKARPPLEEKEHWATKWLRITTALTINNNEQSTNCHKHHRDNDNELCGNDTQVFITVGGNRLRPEGDDFCCHGCRSQNKLIASGCKLSTLNKSSKSVSSFSISVSPTSDSPVVMPPASIGTAPLTMESQIPTSSGNQQPSTNTDPLKTITSDTQHKLPLHLQQKIRIQTDFNEVLLHNIASSKSINAERNDNTTQNQTSNSRLLKANSKFVRDSKIMTAELALHSLGLSCLQEPLEDYFLNFFHSLQDVTDNERGDHRNVTLEERDQQQNGSSKSNKHEITEPCLNVINNDLVKTQQYANIACTTTECNDNSNDGRQNLKGDISPPKYIEQRKQQKRKQRRLHCHNYKDSLTNTRKHKNNALNLPSGEANLQQPQHSQVQSPVHNENISIKMSLLNTSHVKPQFPHIDYSWKTIDDYLARKNSNNKTQSTNSGGSKNDNYMPYVAFFPLTKKGMMINVWLNDNSPSPMVASDIPIASTSNINQQQSVATSDSSYYDMTSFENSTTNHNSATTPIKPSRQQPQHNFPYKVIVRYGEVVFLRGDVVHGGGILPTGLRVHCFLYWSERDIPNDNTYITRDGTMALAELYHTPITDYKVYPFDWYEGFVNGSCDNVNDTNGGICKNEIKDADSDNNNSKSTCNYLKASPNDSGGSCKEESILRATSKIASSPVLPLSTVMSIDAANTTTLTV